MAKVCIYGAIGRVGQLLSLLLRRDPRVTTLSLYDVVSPAGVVEDLKGCNYSSKVYGYTGTKGLESALKDATIVVVVAGVTSSTSSADGQKLSLDKIFRISYLHALQL